MYVDWSGREQEDLEMENMRRDQQEFPISIFPPEIPYEAGDELLHSTSHPFCSDPSCLCHADESLILEVLVNPFMDGLLTNEEGLRLMQGQQL